MWQCSGCAEQLEDQFDTCWKCGTRHDGNHDPAFQVSEPLDQQAQAPESVEEDTALPNLELPSVTYFAIPVWLWVYAVMMMFAWNDRSLPNGRHDFSMSLWEIALLVSMILLIGIPIFVRMLRIVWESCQELTRQRRPMDGMSQLLWVLSMFRLPETIHERCRWFVPVYYGSFAAPLIGFIGAITFSFGR